MVPGILGLLALGVLGYWPHRLEEVDLFSDIGRLDQHRCITYQDDWGDGFCRTRGEGRSAGWFAGAPACLAADQRRPTRLDVTLHEDLQGESRPFVLSPYLPDREALVEQVEDCSWMQPQLRTVGGLDPATGAHDPDHLYWGAYRIGPEVDVGAALPPPGSTVTVDRSALEAAIARIQPAPNWDRMAAAGQTWGQVVLVGLVLVFEERALQGTPAEALLGLALWAHAVTEVDHLYGPDLLDSLGLPPTIPPADPRLLSLRDGIRGLFPLDAHVPTRSTGWGPVKAAFDRSGGG